MKNLGIIGIVINSKKPDVVGVLEYASLAQFLFFNERFLEGEYRCWSFRANDSRTFGIPLGLMVRRNLQVESVDLVVSKSFGYRGVIITDVIKDGYEFTLVLVHLKSKIEEKLGESALKRDKQGDSLRQIIEEKLQADPDADIIICGDFNDFPGRDDQKETAGVEDLIEKMMKSIVFDDGREVKIYSPTLMYSDRDVSGELWTERTKEFGSVLLDYFFLTEGANDEFLNVDHVYPGEFSGVLQASDHIPVVLDLEDG